MNNHLENGKDFLNRPVEINFKNIIILFVLAIGIYLLIPRLIGAEQAVKLIRHLNKWWLILAVFMEIFSYSSAAWLHGIILNRLGYRISFKNRFKISSISAFAIHFFPLGTFGESFVSYHFFRKKDVNSGSILLMLLMRVIFVYIAFLLIFVIGLMSVPATPNLPFSPKLAAGILSIVILIGVLYWIYLYHNKSQYEKVWNFLIRIVNRVLWIFRRPKVKAEKREEIFDDLHVGMRLFAQKKSAFALAIIAALFYWLGDITCFFFVYKSFGFVIHPGILMFGYGVATLASLITFIPGGLGIAEGSMWLVYSGLGIAGSLALMAILVFRFFSFWIWIPIGLYSYLTLQKRGIDESA